MRKTSILFSLLLIPAMFFLGCGDDEDTGNSEGIEGTGTYDFKAVVVDFVSDSPLAGVAVMVVDNSTGEVLDKYGVATSNILGEVTFKGLEDEFVGFLCMEQEGQYVDTYQFDIVAKAQNEKLWFVDSATYESAPLGANILNFDPTQGTVAGAVYYRERLPDDEKGPEEIVGCSTIEIDPPTEDVRYFGDNRLPVATQVRDNLNPRNGYFIAANIPLDGTGSAEVLVKSMMDGIGQIGETTIFCKPNSIVINNIYVEEYMSEDTVNPMPAGCE